MGQLAGDDGILQQGMGLVHHRLATVDGEVPQQGI
jgi:hypothetical protein